MNQPTICRVPNASVEASCNCARSSLMASNTAGARVFAGRFTSSWWRIRTPFTLELEVSPCNKALFWSLATSRAKLNRTSPDSKAQNNAQRSGQSVVKSSGLRSLHTEVRLAKMADADGTPLSLFFDVFRVFFGWHSLCHYVRLSSEQKLQGQDSGPSNKSLWIFCTGRFSHHVLVGWFLQKKKKRWMETKGLSTSLQTWDLWDSTPFLRSQKFQEHRYSTPEENTLKVKQNMAPRTSS